MTSLFFTFTLIANRVGLSVFSFVFIFIWTIVLLWGHWYPCFGFLVTSPVGFKALSALWGADQVHILSKDITVWQQWLSNPRSSDHECCALTIRQLRPGPCFFPSFVFICYLSWMRRLMNY